ncbi:nucleotidyltransferase [Aliarcobacter butzleri]
MDLQKEFEDFHAQIKLGTYEENSTLRDKRDLLISELETKLEDEKIPGTDKKLTFSKLDQGSYAMNTGIKPIDDDFDIDVGVIFNITNEEYDSGKLKKLVFDKLNSHNKRSVKYNRPCVTVEYKDGYHVDLAIYSKNNDDIHIAWGKENSQEKCWYKSEPKKLTQWVSDVSSDAEESKQFRRSVRFLKKWKEKKFVSDGNAAPASIGLTIQARNHFKYFEGSYLNALIHIVNGMKRDFYNNTQTQMMNIVICLPVEPYKNVYYKMSEPQQNNFSEQVDALLEALISAKEHSSRKEACKILRKIFGVEFPLSDDDDATENSKALPFVTTGNNA